MPGSSIRHADQWREVVHGRRNLQATPLVTPKQLDVHARAVHLELPGMVLGLMCMQPSLMYGAAGSCTRITVT